MIKKRNEILFGILIILFIVPLISAVSPQGNNNPDGLDIKIPPFDSFPLNQDITFNIHVFNMTNGSFIDNSSTSCFFHLYNQTGVQVVNLTMPYDSNTNVNNEWEIIISSGNFTTSGSYGYGVYCNTTSGVGGFAVNGFEISSTGVILSTGQAILYCFFLLTAFPIIFVLFYFSFKIPFKNTKNQNGFFVSVNKKKWIKLVCMTMLYIITMWTFGLLYSISNNYLTLGSLAQFFYYFYYIMLSLMIPLGVLAIIISIIVWLKDLKISQGIKQNLRVR